MKSQNPNHYFLSPHMSQEEVNEFLEDALREKFGPQVEEMILFSRMLQTLMAGKEAAQTPPTESKS